MLPSTRYRFLSMILRKPALTLLALSAFFLSCSKDSEPDPPATGDTYYYPPLTGTTWETISPEELGWDTAKLDELSSYVESNNSSAFIILHKGKIVLEKYWLGTSATSSFRIFSASKSIAAFLTGVAEEQGKLQLDDAVSDYLGTGWSNATPAQEGQITIRHLITMTSGLTEGLAYEADPGTKWYYNTLAYHKIYQVLAAAVGKSNDAYTQELLWGAIGMQNSFWDTEPGGGPSMSCSGRDMARFGLMILSEGSWNGTPVLDNPAYFDGMLNPAQDLNRAYGYLWWLNGHESFLLPGTDGTVYNGPLVANAPSDLVAALGFGDKKIYVVKSEDLVVIRHGAPSNAPVTYALSNFDNEIWRRLMEALP